MASSVSDSWQPYGLYSTRILCPWDFPSKKTVVGWYALLHGIFLTQGSNPYVSCLLHWQAVPPGKSIASPKSILAALVNQIRVWKEPEFTNLSLQRKYFQVLRNCLFNEAFTRQHCRLIQCNEHMHSCSCLE